MPRSIAFSSYRVQTGVNIRLVMTSMLDPATKMWPWFHIRSEPATWVDEENSSVPCI